MQPKQITNKQLEVWLDEMAVSYSYCPNCSGLHLEKFNELDFVNDCKLEIYDGLLIWSSSIDFSASQILQINAALTQLGIQNPEFKILLEVDDAGHQLLVVHTAVVSEGLLDSQFTALFTRLSQGFIGLLEQLQQLQLLTPQVIDIMELPEYDRIH
ncbi:hypothetical protein [Paraferrimonas sp. SM1919]|uniref:hypothetical protein n=1 Tax=Paraferrimonas sp. SM1919 TaxID=2662263 RepID=UPI0013D2689D|nr:hypothetical protein [Paraferrimonas sp. SM1919]